MLRTTSRIISNLSSMKSIECIKILNILKCFAGAKDYKQAHDAGGALGWRLTADEVSALDATSDNMQVGTGLPFENW